MTTRNKRKLAGLNRENCEELPRSNLEQNSNAPRLQEDYITQGSEKFEGRVTKRLSKEFSRTKSRILGALARLDNFLMNPLLQGHSGTTPEPYRNALSISQGKYEDDSQNDPHPEAGLFHGQMAQNSGPEDSHDTISQKTYSSTKFSHGQVESTFGSPAGMVVSEGRKMLAEFPRSTAKFIFISIKNYSSSKISNQVDRQNDVLTILREFFLVRRPEFFAECLKKITKMFFFQKSLLSKASFDMYSAVLITCTKYSDKRPEKNFSESSKDENKTSQRKNSTFIKKFCTRTLHKCCTSGHVHGHFDQISEISNKNQNCYRSKSQRVEQKLWWVCGCRSKCVSGPDNSLTSSGILCRVSIFTFDTSSVSLFLDAFSKEA